MKAKLLNEQITGFYEEYKQPDGSVVLPETFKKIANILIFALQFLKMFTNDEIDHYIDILVEALHKLIDSATP